MKKKSKILAFLYFSALTSAMLMSNAHAYIDPGAMTYIIQLVAGVVIAASAALGFYWRKIVRFFTRGGAPASKRFGGSAVAGDFDFPHLFRDEEYFCDEYFLSDAVLAERNAVSDVDEDDEDYWYFDDEDE